MKPIQTCLSSVLAMVLTFAFALPIGASAASFSDLRGHWAAQYITDAVEHGYVDGYENGSFLPNNPVTRAEFCKMMNQALSLNNTTPIQFSDTSSAAWYHNEIAKAVAAGYISGYEDNSFRPDQSISRQEAAVVLSRIITEAESQDDLSALRDAGSIDDWAKDGAQTAFSKGYMAGDNQKNFKPQGNLTRAEAVKILEGVLSGEQIHRDTVTLSADETVSNGLYTGTLDISADGKVNLQNCRVLGTLSVSGSSTLDLQDSRVAKLSLASTSGGAAVTVSGKSDIARTTASSGGSLTESSLSGDGFRNLELNGARLFIQPLQLSGLFDQVQVATPSKLSLRAGSISLLQLESGAGSSQIELLTGTSVARAELNAAANFTGRGLITLAILTDTGSTFENKPTRVEDNGSGDVNLGTGLFPSITPSSGSTGVAPSTDITVTFNEVPYTNTNGVVTSSYVENSVVEVRRGSETGNKVSFSVSLSSNNRVMLISPDANLDSSSKYYVIVKPSLRSNIGQTNARHVFSFSTTSGLSPTAYPADGATLIPVNTVLRLEFDESVYQSNGSSSLNSSYLSGSVLELHRESQTGRSVAFSASVSSNRKTITIDPTDSLDTSTKYYLVVRGGSLANSSRDTLPEQVYSFTTASSSVLVPSMTPSNGATKVPTGTDILLDFKTPIYNSSGNALTSAYLKDSVLSLHRDSTTGSAVSFSASISSNRARVTLTPNSALRANTSYYLILSDGSLCDGSGSERRYNGRLVLSFTTGTEENRRHLDPTVSPRNAASNISADTDITLEFDTSIYQANSSGSEITSSYLRDSVIELREDSASGDRLSFSASLNANRRVVTLSPTYNLERDTRYYVIVRDGSIQNANREHNEKFTSYFTVGTEGGGGLRNPDISPSNGSSGVSATTDVTLDFGQTLYDTNGTLISALGNPSSYLQNCFELRAGSESGAQVSFSANLYNSGRSVTVDPTESLPGGVTYYLILKEGYLRSSDAEYNRRMVHHFSVGSSLALSSTSPSSGASGVSVGSNIVLNFNEAISNSGGGVLTLNDLQSHLTLTDSIPYTISVAGSSLTITPTKPLTANKSHTLTLTAGCIKGTSGGLNAGASFSFTTSQDAAPSIIPAPTMAVDPVAKSISLTFASNLLKADKSALDETYIFDKLKLTEDNANGATVYYTAKSREGVISLTVDDMKPDTVYCATALAGSFASSNNGTTEAFSTTVRSPDANVSLKIPAVTKDSATFLISYTYPITLDLTITPEDGAEETIERNFTPSQNPLEITPKGLTSHTKYTVSLTYSISGGSQTTITDKFTTDGISSDDTLASVTVKDKNGSRSHSFATNNLTINNLVPFTDGYVDLILNGNSKATMTVNETPQPMGQVFKNYLNVAGSVCAIKITAEDGGDPSQYTLTLMPAEQ